MSVYYENTIEPSSTACLKSTTNVPEKIETATMKKRKTTLMGMVVAIMVAIVTLFLAFSAVFVITFGKQSDQIEVLSASLQKMEALMKLTQHAPRSCHYYWEHGMKKSMMYLIDPDGPWQGIPPILVYCNLDSGATVISHNMPGKRNIAQCRTKDCFNLTLNYAVDMTQITSLIDISERCHQRITFGCFGSKLTKIGSWVDRHGVQQTYFSGKNYGQHICGCAEDFDCFSTGQTNLCNCDQGDPIERFDEGQITNMTALPITAFYYGNMYLPSQKASVDIGPLECFGSHEYSPNGDSCQSIKMQGRPSGYYIVDSTEDPSGSKMIVRCDTAAKLNQIQTEVVTVLHEGPSVDIDVIIEQSHRVEPGHPISFDRLVSNNGDDFNLNTSTFTVPHSGPYMMQEYDFRCAKNSGRSMYAYVNVNETTVNISDRGIVVGFKKGDSVVITRYSGHTGIDLGCTKEKPCRLTIRSSI